MNRLKHLEPELDSLLPLVIIPIVLISRLRFAGGVTRTLRLMVSHRGTVGRGMTHELLSRWQIRIRLTFPNPEAGLAGSADA